MRIFCIQLGGKLLRILEVKEYYKKETNQGSLTKLEGGKQMKIWYDAAHSYVFNMNGKYCSWFHGNGGKRVGVPVCRSAL